MTSSITMNYHTALTLYWMFLSFGKISNIAKWHADTTKKRRRKHISNFNSIFSQTPLPSQVNISIKYWAFLFLKASSRVFLTPLEETKWQRSKHIRKHACHYAVSAPCQWKLSFIKCTCPVCLECKKKDPSPLSIQSCCQRQRESFILSEKWDIN